MSDGEPIERFEKGEMQTNSDLEAELMTDGGRRDSLQQHA